MATENQPKSVLEPWFELHKIVLVTGASSGLGWQFCFDLAKSGCRIIAMARRTDRLKSLCDEINKKYPITTVEHGRAQLRAVAMWLDISACEAIIADRVKKAWDVFGRIDALVNNAGTRERLHAPFDLLETDWNTIIQTNQTGTWLMSKHMCKLMREAKHGGSVINISSLNGTNRVVLQGGHAYSASKVAVNMITKVMAAEFGTYNIRVNAIIPGLFESEITKELMKNKGLYRAMSKGVPLGSFGTTDPALTSLIRYLIHDSSQYVTGNNFIVDAGHTLVGVPIFSSL